MTVQELINELNKIVDKSKKVLDYDFISITEILECSNTIILR